LKILQAVCAHEAKVDVAFCEVAEASADIFAAGVTWSQQEVCHDQSPLRSFAVLFPLRKQEVEIEQTAQGERPFFWGKQDSQTQNQHLWKTHKK
jgi:hypothetical protein